MKYLITFLILVALLLVGKLIFFLGQVSVPEANSPGENTGITFEQLVSEGEERGIQVKSITLELQGYEGNKEFFAKTRQFVNQEIGPSATFENPKGSDGVELSFILIQEE